MLDFLRLAIDRKYQQRHGRAIILKVVRRLKAYPEVELIAPSY
ncbi:hypothetical protein [Nostoc sp. DSM 114161]